MRAYELYESNYFTDLANNIWNFSKNRTDDERTYLRDASRADPNSWEGYLWRLHMDINYNKVWDTPEELADTMRDNITGYDGYDVTIKDHSIYAKIKNYLETRNRNEVKENKVDWSKHHWDAPPSSEKPRGGNYAYCAEMVPVEWLLKLRGNELHKRLKTNIGYNPDSEDWDRGNLEDLAKSLKTRGVQEPVIIIVGWKDGYAYVGEGNHRVAAADIAGIDELPARIIMHKVVGEGMYRYDVTKNLTFDPEEEKTDMFSKVQYYERPSQVFKSFAK